jgi:hypothetical protein
MATRMQQRRGTATEWTTVNPILAAGEIGFETDTGKFKIGDGTNPWNSLLAYGSLDSVINAAPSTLDTLNELAAAINDDPDFYSNITATITTAVTQLNNSISSNRADVDANLASAIADEEANRNAAISGAITAEQIARGDAINAEAAARSAAITSAISTEETNRNTAIATAVSDLTTAYGNADDALQVEIQTYVDGEVSALETSLTAYVDSVGATAESNATTAAETYTDSAIATHSLVTTNVHGIADTSALATTTDVSNAQAAAEAYADGLAVNYDAAGSATTAQTNAEAYADAAVTTHNSDTTGVHGITDTADLALLSANTQTFSGDITIGGNLTVSGTTTTVSATDLVVTDPLIYIGEGNSGNAVDLGLVSSFNDGTYQHAGIVRDASDDKWKLFKGVTDEPTTTINFAQGSLDNLAVNNIEVVGVVFSDGTQTKIGVPSITPITQKTGSYSLGSLDERDTIIEVDSGSATTITIPNDSTLNFPVGTTLDIIQVGTGQVTIAPGSGVTVNGTPGLKLRTQWSSVTLLKRAANTWLVFGDTAA